MKRRHFARTDASRDFRRVEQEERQRRKDRITLAKVMPRRDPLKYSGEARKHVVAEIMDMLKDWRLSPFEHEGDCRHGVRSALCLDGRSWFLADTEAASLVSEAFALGGAERPSWQEGQWSYTDSPDRCSWCHGPIDDNDRSRSQRFCGPDCARSALEKRVYETRSSADAIGQAAYILIARKRRPAVSCAHCGKSFHPRDAGAKLCSPSCIRARGALLADRACLWCGTAFHPRDASMLCCSKSCAGKHQLRSRAERLPERSCQLCRARFRPRTEWAVYCSPGCGRIIANRAYRARQRAVTPPAAAPFACDWCGKPVVNRGPRSRTCSKNCSVYLANARAGKFPKRLSAPVFDFIFAIAA